jgi:hypothetical protein
MSLTGNESYISHTSADLYDFVGLGSSSNGYDAPGRTSGESKSRSGNNNENNNDSITLTPEERLHSLLQGLQRGVEKKGSGASGKGSGVSDRSHDMSSRKVSTSAESKSSRNGYSNIQDRHGSSKDSTNSRRYDPSLHDVASMDVRSFYPNGASARPTSNQFSSNAPVRSTPDVVTNMQDSYLNSTDTNIRALLRASHQQQNKNNGAYPKVHAAWGDVLEQQEAMMSAGGSSGDTNVNGNNKMSSSGNTPGYVYVLLYIYVMGIIGVIVV